MKILHSPLLLFVLSGLLAVLVYFGQQPPHALAVNAASDVFSANRALQKLERLNPEELPHPAGSEHHALVRERIVAQLQEFGFQTELQSLYHCHPAFGICSQVENILARLKGSKYETAVLLTAHYDSVEAGPGVGDDAAGVAALLEIAEMAAAGDGFDHQVIFLVSDGEEQALIGADAFARLHPWFKQVQAVINLEARGVSGSSVMFETGENNRSFIRIMAQSLDRPVANSLSREVYKRMPNDTDYSVYRELGIGGFNFAFTGGGAVYHSAIDNLAQLDTGSLQHHGQNAWALLKALDKRQLARITSQEDAVYADLFGRKLVHFPASSSTGLAVVLGVLVLVFIGMAFPRHLTMRKGIWAALHIVILVVLVLSAGWLLSFPLGHWVDINRMGHPYPWLGQVVLVLAVVLAIRLIFQSISQRSGTGSVTLVCWLFYALFALLLSIKLPAASFLGILPLLAFLLGAILDGIFWKRHTRLLLARYAGFLATAYFGFYFLFALEVVASFEIAALLMVPLVLPAIAIMPLLVNDANDVSSSRLPALSLVVLILLACAGQQFLPTHTVDRPRAMNLVYRSPGLDVLPLWLLETGASSADKQYSSRHGFEPGTVPVAGRASQDALSRAAIALELHEVSLLGVESRVSGGRQKWLISLEIPNAVRQLTIYLPKTVNVETVRVDRVLALDTSRDKKSRWRPSSVVLNRPSAGKLLLELEGLAPASDEVLNFDLPVRIRYALDPSVLTPLLEGWPLDAQANRFGHRAEIDRLLHVSVK